MDRDPLQQKAEPGASKTTHNTLLEVVWTVVPVIILLIIAVPSFRLLYYTDRVEEADMTLKAIGHQWYWSYEYPDHGDFTFDALMLEDDELEEGQPACWPPTRRWSFRWAPRSGC